MKTKSVFSFGLIFLFVFVFVLGGCKKNNTDVVQPTPTNQVPSTFKVDVPSSMNSSSAKSVEADTLTGGVIYANLRTFINVGCAAADVVQGIMTAIYSLNITSAMSFSYPSHEDGRTKSFVVVQNAAYNGTTYQYKMTVSDQSSPAIQVFWNNNPVKGVAIISPYDWDRNIGTTYSNTKYKVEYSEEASVTGYEKQMIVSIAGFPQLVSANTNYINNMKMFVGKNGNLLTMWGNSNHPSATIVDPALVGKCYSFVAHSDASLNIGIAKVAISPTDVASTVDIFNTYSVYNVLNTAIHVVYPTATQNQINSYLKNTDQPAFFTAPTGFVSCGTTVPNNTGFTDSFNDISSLIPYVPSDIKNLTISFQ